MIPVKHGMTTFAAAERPRHNIGKTLVTFGALAAFGWVLSSAVAATAARADTTDEILDMLRRKGEITKAEYDRLKARHEAEKNALPPGYAAGSLKDGGAAPEYVTALPKGVGIRIGSVDVKFSGDISFFAIQDFEQHHFVEIDGGLINSGFHNDSNSIRAGLLPSSLQIGFSTTQNGYDIGAFFGVYIGGNNTNPGTALNANSLGSPVGLSTAGVDWRQVYGTVGTADRGTIKFGRDIGIFGQDAILNDLTIFGSGTPAHNQAPTDTTLGRIGVGYVYADFMPQITYTSPEWRGFTFTAGIFTPLNAFDLSGDSADITGQDSPMVQGRLKFHRDFGGECGLKDVDCRPPVKFTAWTSFVWQDHQNEWVNVDPRSAFHVPEVLDHNVGGSFTSWGVDGGFRTDWNGLSVVGYIYTGTGLGTTAFFFDAFDVFGNARDSHGGYIQASYTFRDRLTVGGSWGESDLDRTAFDPDTLFRSLGSSIGFVRYKLSDWVQLQWEYVHTEETNQGGDFEGRRKIEDDAIIGGATIFW
jgi:hypothetical protein